MAKTTTKGKSSSRNLWNDLEAFFNNSGISELKICKEDVRNEFRLIAYADNIEMNISGQGKRLEDAIIDAVQKSNQKVDVGLKFVNALKI